jgi:hypothetical protein
MAVSNNGNLCRGACAFILFVDLKFLRQTFVVKAAGCLA